MTTNDGGAGIGAAHFGIGLDFAQYERDLDKAEQLARTRAQKIQGILGGIPVGQAAAAGAVAPVAVGAAHAVRPPAPAQQQRTVAPWVQTVYDTLTAGGASHQDAVAALRKTGLRAEEIPGQAGATVSAASTIRSTETEARRLARERSQQMRTMQQRAERDARIEGRAFSRVSTGQTIRPIGGSAGGGALEFLGLSGGQGILRAVGALTGVGLGLNVAALAASRLHEAMAASIGAAVQLEQSTRQIGVAFGSGAGAFTGAGAAAFAANPRTAGTTQQYLQAAASLAPLANQYGITTAQVHQLVIAEGELARLHGVDLPQASQILQSVLRGDMEAGQALGLTLTDQYGRLRSVGLSFDELTQAVGRNRAEQQLVKDIQEQSTAQMANDAAQADSTAQALGRLAKAWDNVHSASAKAASGPVGGIAGGAANLLEGKTGAGVDLGPPIPPLWQLILDRVTGNPSSGTAARAAWVAQQRAKAATPAPQPLVDPENPTQGEIDRAIHGAHQIDLENPTQAQLDKVLGAGRLQRTNAATEQANRAAIAGRQAQAQLDTLGAQSDLRRLGIQQQVNELAQTRLDIESRLAPVMLEQQRVQDRITLTTRENLDLTEATLRAQQAAVPTANAAFELDYRRQVLRAQAAVQQSRAIRGLGPAPGIPGIPELFQQGLNLALAAPEVDYAALLMQHPADVAARAQAAAATTRQLAAVPDARRLQQLQNQLIPLGQARSAAQAAADAIERSLQGADLVAGPERIAAEQRLAEARMQQADAAGKIAAAQAETNPQINASANVTIAGLTDVAAATDAILEKLRPVIDASIRAAVSNNQRSSGTVGDLP